MKILISYVETIFFLYNFIAHFTLLLLNILYDTKLREIICSKKLNKNNMDKLYFIFGHLLIAFVMLFRIGINLSGNIIVSLVGSIAHTFLFLSYLVLIILYKRITLLDIIFLLGQIGMIYTYNIQHIKEDVKDMTTRERCTILLSFILLAIYYLVVYIKSPNNMIKYGKLLVLLVYILLIILFYLHNKYYHYISIF